MPKKPNLSNPVKPSNVSKKMNLSQQDIPACSLGKALRIARTIVDNYGKKPATPLEVASALKVQPSSGGFRMLVAASHAYGLTTADGSGIQVTQLGNRILHPELEGDDIAAKREALLRPRVLREFLQRYDDHPIPPDNIAQNVLVSMGVPQDRTAGVLSLILAQIEELGLMKEISSKKYVYLKGVKIQPAAENLEERDDEIVADTEAVVVGDVPDRPPAPHSSSSADDVRLKRVYITHGKNRAFVDPIRNLLKFGELDAVVSTEKPTVAQPVPKKVMDDMRSCGAAIIHIDDERKLLDPETKEVVTLNENVLIEIGAAMALYGERYIFLVRDGVKLPSNLQGLYEVRYASEKLDGDETIKLLNAIKDLKSRPLPH